MYTEHAKQIPRSKGQNIGSSESSDIFEKYEQSLSKPIDTDLVKKFNGSHLAFYALGKNLKERSKMASKIKGGKY